MKKALLNVLGFFAGAIAFWIASLALSLVFTAILSVPFLANLLSFPSTPELYVTMGMNLGSLYCAFIVCKSISAPTKKGVKPALILLFALLTLLYGIATIRGILNYGLTDATWGNGAATLLSIFLIFEDISGKTDE